MKKIAFIIFGISCYTAMLAAPGGGKTEAAPSSVGVMEYKSANVSKGNWIRSTEKDRAYVRDLVDKMAADGFNTVIITGFDFLPMEVVDYSKTPYPEAAQFPAAQVNDQLKTLRENIRYAKSKGIKWVLTRSNSNNAPFNFWKAHQQELNPGGMFDHLLSVAHWNNNYAAAMKGDAPWVAPHQQWRNPLYRKFYLYSTERVLDLIPELDGFSNNYSEVAWTFDLQKVREDKWRDWRECKDLDATDEDFLDWSQAHYDILKRKRGENFRYGIRDWYIRPEALQRLPKYPNTVIDVKYGGYDQPVANYPPWAEDLVQQGYRITLSMHLYDAEWPHPLYWYSAEFLSRVFSHYYQGGFSGFSSLDYINRGDIKDNPIKLLFQKNTSEAMYGRPFTNNDAIKFLAPIYGTKASEQILRSLADITTAQENYIKLLPAWFWRGDGLSPTGINTHAYWMFSDNPEAPDRMGFMRQNVVGVPEYCAEAIKGKEALDAAIQRWRKENRITPYEVIDLLQRCADDAVVAIMKARTLAPAKAPIVKDLVANAYVHKALIDRSEAFIRSALDLRLSGYIWDGQYEQSKSRTDTGIDLTGDFRQQMDKFLSADVLMRALRAEYCPRSRGRGQVPSYTAAKQAAELVGFRIEIPELENKEFDRISRLIEGN